MGQANVTQSPEIRDQFEALDKLLRRICYMQMNENPTLPEPTRMAENFCKDAIAEYTHIFRTDRDEWGAMKSPDLEVQKERLDKRWQNRAARFLIPPKPKV